ncbi:Hypothetical predicted protein, partial [Mytilus galloprovincialis]
VCHALELQEYPDGLTAKDAKAICGTSGLESDPSDLKILSKLYGHEFWTGLGKFSQLTPWIETMAYTETIKTAKAENGLCTTLTCTFPDTVDLEAAYCKGDNSIKGLCEDATQSISGTLYGLPQNRVSKNCRADDKLLLHYDACKQFPLNKNLTSPAWTNVFREEITVERTFGEATPLPQLCQSAIISDKGEHNLNIHWQNCSIKLEWFVCKNGTSTVEKTYNEDVATDENYDMEDLLHLTSKYIIGEADRTKEVFIFREGSMVCWNVPELERRAILTFLHRHIDEPYSFDQIYEEEEWMEYSSSKNFSCLQGDVLFIQDLDHIDVTETINPHKYAFSNALAQTVKLAVWESALESLVDSIEPINRVLKLEKKVPCKRREILKMHGEIFELRFQMNLNSELLNTPDFYWEKHHALETLYKHLYNHLDIGRRTKVMNEKLNYCEQVIEVVDKQAADTRTERLERIIILLIMIEVMFELLYFYERKSLKKTDDSHIDGPTRQSDNSQIDGPS